MEEILDLTVKLRQKSHDIGDEIAILLKPEPREMPAGVFGMIFNNYTLLLELLNYYFGSWKKATATRCSSIEEARKENGERVILVQKMVFIQTMSSIEFCCKDYVKRNPEKIGEFEGWLYLSKIIKRCKKLKVITDSDFKLWKGANELRNTLVHNNGISENTVTYRFPKCTLELCEGQMMRGNIKLFPLVSDWLLDATRSLIIEMSKK